MYQKHIKKTVCITKYSIYTSFSLVYKILHLLGAYDTGIILQAKL